MRSMVSIAAILLGVIVIPVQATVLFSQPPDPAGGHDKSAWFAPNGFDGDQYTWDDFTLNSTQTFNRISWQGVYTNYLSGAGKAPVYNFTISICASIGGFQPDVINTPLAEFDVGGNAAETLSGTTAGLLTYDYTYTMPTPFQAVAGNKYWVQIEAWQGVTPQYSWPPDWSLTYATGGNAGHFRGIVGGGGAATAGNPAAPDPSFPVGMFYQNMSHDLTFSLSSVTPVVNAIWSANGNGNWTENGNWNNNAHPDGTDHTATFGPVITVPRTVTVDAPCSVGTINFNNSNSYTLNGTSTLTLDATVQAGINVAAGGHTIAAPLALNTDTTITVDSFFSVLSVTGPLTATGRTITTAGNGSVQFENIRAAALHIASSSTVILSPKPTPNSPAGTSVLDSLLIDYAGTQLDLNNNAMVLNYTSVGTLVDDIRAQMANWTIYSSLSDANHALGYGDNAILGQTNFGGQVVGPNCVLIKFTYGGDANLDGEVDISDLGALATAWQTSAPWTGGDFNYDGFIDISDLGILATNWQLGVGSPLGPSFDEALASVGLVGVSVPEPSIVGALAGVVGLHLRRRRR